MAELLYEGKAKQVYLTDKDDEYLIHYKDDATAGNGVKHDQFEGKGVLNNTISCIIFDMLEEAGIKTHMIKKLNERDILVKKVDIFPLEVIIRNITTGSFCKRLGAPEGVVLEEPIFEISYKNDDYGDPLINEDHAVALKLCTREEYNFIKQETLKINELLKEFIVFSYPIESFQTLLVIKISSLFIPLSFIALPISFSFLYTDAVSICL